MSKLDFGIKKQNGQKITMVTCYDATFAKLLAQTSVDCLLVGDSVAMVCHGFENTLMATTDMMAVHTAAVVRGAPKKFVVADMPFLTFRKGVGPAMEAVEKLMQAGASAVKIENVEGHEEVVEHIVKSGVPVMGHLGLTPQSVHQLGGFKVQGKTVEVAKKILIDSLKLEALGCFSLVLECVPQAVSEEITQSLKIPTIGIGAGSVTDGQVLVLYDLLGLQNEFSPKFLRRFLNSGTLTVEAVDAYCHAVREKTFPNEKETYL